MDTPKATSRFLPVLLLVLGLALLENRERLWHWLHPLPPIATTESVVLYATAWCGYCAKARRFFADNQIAYSELDVEKSAAGRAGYERLGGGSVPIIVIGGRKVLRGYDAEALAEALREAAP
ncbi:MAG: glutaredoxin family protein [Candidatus Methylumidiphilus sp.]